MKTKIFAQKHLFYAIFTVLSIWPMTTTRAANESITSSSAASNETADETLSISQVGSEMISVAIEEYNQALFNAAYQTLLKAKNYEKFLTAADQNNLNKYLRASKDAVDKRKLALQDVNSARINLTAGRLIEAQAHLKNVQASPYLMAREKEAVAESMKKIETLLSEQKKQIQKIYDNSVKLYKSKKLEQAREGFIKVAMSGLLDLPEGQTAEDYIHKIDTQIGRSVDLSQISSLKQPGTSTAIDLFSKEKTTKDVNTPPASITKDETSKAKPAIKNTVAEGYLKAVVNDAVIKCKGFLDNGNPVEAQKCIENAAKILDENRRFLDDTTFNEYNRILNNALILQR